MTPAPLEIRRKYNVFCEGDVVRITKNLYWTEHANNNIGKVGTITRKGNIGLMQTYQISTDSGETMLADEGEIEFI